MVIEHGQGRGAELIEMFGSYGPLLDGPGTETIHDLFHESVDGQENVSPLVGSDSPQTLELDFPIQEAVDVEQLGSAFAFGRRQPVLVHLDRQPYEVAQRLVHPVSLLRRELEPLQGTHDEGNRRVVQVGLQQNGIGAPLLRTAAIQISMEGPVLQEIRSQAKFYEPRTFARQCADAQELDGVVGGDVVGPERDLEGVQSTGDMNP